MSKMVKYWYDNYGYTGVDDKRSVETFLDCETREISQSLKNELIGISQGVYKKEALDIMLGQSRTARYGSYEEWAKYMLIWMASYKS